jgi:hypothetical protein
MKKHTAVLDHLHAATLRVAKFHIVFALLFTTQTIIFHASKIITPELLLQRWIAISSLAAIAIAVWLLARSKPSVEAVYRSAIGLVIIADIAFAAFNVYTQRGYASKSVFLFLIPIIVAAVLLNRSVLFAVAGLCAAVYSTTVIMYFVNNFNEGYMSEMYAELGLYSGLFLIVAALLWTTIHKHNARS